MCTIEVESIRIEGKTVGQFGERYVQNRQSSRLASELVLPRTRKMG